MSKGKVGGFFLEVPNIEFRSDAFEAVEQLSRSAFVMYLEKRVL